ncbi:hypothetical protein [Bradyrhizobium sp. CCBAU 53338]|uniref:hypothetical protein n=1 Tax=Bradyrhizobium sp. CCBAU 53338 TaxID=1325111 RepID=UPI00188A445D|nr:hypothetical protein [Bradyrhizobium sp. CCBAU 53338]
MGTKITGTSVKGLSPSPKVRDGSLLFVAEQLVGASVDEVHAATRRAFYDGESIPFGGPILIDPLLDIFGSRRTSKHDAAHVSSSGRLVARHMTQINNLPIFRAP